MDCFYLTNPQNIRIFSIALFVQDINPAVFEDYEFERRDLSYLSHFLAFSGYQKNNARNKKILSYWCIRPNTESIYLTT